jgi:hypothetical protein
VKRTSDFRRWVQEMWYRHEDECEAYRDYAKSPTEYWASNTSGGSNVNTVFKLKDDNEH